MAPKPQASSCKNETNDSIGSNVSSKSGHSQAETFQGNSEPWASTYIKLWGAYQAVSDEEHRPTSLRRTGGKWLLPLRTSDRLGLGRRFVDEVRSILIPVIPSFRKHRDQVQLTASRPLSNRSSKRNLRRWRRLRETWSGRSPRCRRDRQIRTLSKGRRFLHRLLE